MARRRRTPEQVVRKLREADRLLGESADIVPMARHLEISGQTFHSCLHRPARQDPPEG